MVVSSTAVSPVLETPRDPVVRAAFTFDLPDGAATTRNPSARLLTEPSRPVWRHASWHSAQPTPAKRFNKTDRIIAVVAGVCVGWVAGGAIGFYATADRDRYDDGTSGLRGLMIGAPVGAVIGAVLGYRLTR